MAKVKNTGGQPRGFFTEDGGHVTVAPGEEKEFNMTEADFKNLQQNLENTDDPKPYELSGSAGGAKSEKKKAEEEMPAQSSEPPASVATTPPPQMSVTPQAEKERREQQQARGGATKKSDDDDDNGADKRTPHRSR